MYKYFCDACGVSLKEEHREFWWWIGRRNSFPSSPENVIALCETCISKLLLELEKFGDYKRSQSVT